MTDDQRTKKNSMLRSMGLPVSDMEEARERASETGESVYTWRSRIIRARALKEKKPTERVLTSSQLQMKQRSGR